MKIALVGFGKMGRRLAELAQEQGYTLVVCLTHPQWTTLDIAAADVCIDFTQGDALLENVRKIAACKKNMVLGTTGWQAHLPAVRALVDEHGVGAVYGPNFSVGVYVFQQVVEYAAQLLQNCPEYAATGIEYHHATKKDAPSGTACALQEKILTQMPRLERCPFTSVRSGTFPGTHTLLFDAPADTLTFTHTARSRDAFALGALEAALWIQGRRGLFTFEEYMRARLNPSHSVPP